jgi:tetratricopeptide (TPR) repeat protein
MSVRRPVSALPALLLAAALSTAAVDALGQPASATPSAQPAPLEGALSPAELERMLAPLGHDSAEERRAAARAVASLGADAVGPVSEKLAELRRGGDPGVYAVMRGLRDRAAREGGFDLADALAATKPDPGTTRTLVVVSLIRALSHAGTTPAVRTLVLVAPDSGGVFRPELSRQVKQLGDRAIAALIEARRDPSPETRAWAGNLLEGMGKRTPADAVQTRDNQVLADVLRAFAFVRDLDALPVILSFVNSDRTQVRVAARDATAAYGQDAIWKLREAYAVLTGEPAPEGISAADLAKKLFGEYDRFRLQEVLALVDKGLAAQSSGNLEEAVAVFDEALAQQPLLDRRAEMVSAYVAYAESIEDRDRPRALATLRKALRLDEAGPRSSHVRSEIATLEGEDLLARGIPDTEPFEQALALDPQNARARAELDRLRADTEAGKSHAWRLAAAAAVLVLSLAGIVVVGGRRKPAPAS